jgi:sugar transferase EpsL
VLKRLLDVWIATAALVLLSPLISLLAILVRITAGAPVLFRQRRIGFREKPFTFLKFRTMNDGRDSAGALLPDAERLTRTGVFLRTTSLDELPQLWNVLRGEMSIVGPRPLLPEYLPRYTPEQRRRHTVKSGITGWAQVQGRNSISWEKKFDLDIWYVDHQSLWLDCRILALTILHVLRRKGIDERAGVTMSPFLGQAAATDDGEGALMP